MCACLSRCPSRCRDTTDSVEGAVRIYNTGAVFLTQRYLSAYAVSLNMRDYPFDVQTLTWSVRSTIYNNTVVRFIPSSTSNNLAASKLLFDVTDTDWTFSQYSQSAYTLTGGIFAGYDLLTINIVATRISTMSSTFLILPMCLICAALCLEMFMDPGESSRIQTPIACITATMGFSFVVADLCPPVSYNTRMHLLIFQAYVFSAVALVVNTLLWYIKTSCSSLAASNVDNRTLLQDSHELAERLQTLNGKPGVGTVTAKDAAQAKLLGSGLAVVAQADIVISVPRLEAPGKEIQFSGSAFGSSAGESVHLEPDTAALLARFFLHHGKI